MFYAFENIFIKKNQYIFVQHINYKFIKSLWKYESKVQVWVPLQCAITGVKKRKI